MAEAKRDKRRSKKPTNGKGAPLGFEATLMLAADKLRSNMDAAEYKHVVLGLIFLKCISDAFEELHARLTAEQDQGYGRAQRELGFMYYKGRGIEQDYVQALMWYNLAAAHLTITHQLPALVKSRAAVEAKMLPAQVAEAQKMAREWRCLRDHYSWESARRCRPPKRINREFY